MECRVFGDTSNAEFREISQAAPRNLDVIPFSC